MANNLIGNRYIQVDDPGTPPSTGYEWLRPDTGELFMRDIGNTGWLLIGNINDTTLGLLARTGGVMTGPLLGVTGWAPDTSPDFQTSAKKEGIDLATKGDISALRRELLARFNTITQEMLANVSTSSNTRSNVAIKTGITTVGTDYDFTIPLPQYDGGSGETALRSEVIMHTAWPVYCLDPNFSSGNNAFKVELISDADMKWHIKTGRDDLNQWGYNAQAGWLVIAIR